MRNKFVYSCSITICALGFSKLLESIFCILVVMEAFPCKELVKMFEEVPVGWWEVRRLWRWDTTFADKFIQLLRRWLCNVWLGFVAEKNWDLSVNQIWLQVLQFPVSLINLLNLLLKCSGVTGFRKLWWIRLAAYQQTGNMTFSWNKFGCGSALELINPPFHHMSQSNRDVAPCCCIE